jgi:hypothetical protein
MIRAMNPQGSSAHDAYHRFLRVGAWAMEPLWKTLAILLVNTLVKSGTQQLDLDDTLFHKSGRKVQGAGTFRDAVRSAGKRVVYALGLNLVVLTLRIQPPWGGEPLGLPVNMRLYRKGEGRTHLDLAEEMFRQHAEWFPDHRLEAAFDGAYASLAGRKLPCARLTSRMRRDAALYNLPPKRRKGQRGRSRTKGSRLLSPESMAATQRKDWRKFNINFRGKILERLVFSRPVLWYKVCKAQQVLLVIVRDPSGRERDDFFFTTELDALPGSVVEHYAGRWSIEDTFRNVKQFLGGQEQQTWKASGPERAAGLSLWLYSAIWMCYILHDASKPSWIPVPWYTAKRRPSFLDALACLRRALWKERIFARCGSESYPRKILTQLIDALAYAA